MASAPRRAGRVRARFRPANGSRRSRGVGASRVPPRRPLPFGQLTLLCLVQQLGTTLSRDDAAVATKLDWLQLAVLGLDAGDARIRAYVPEVLRQVKACLEQLPPRTRSTHRAPVSILVRVITSLLALPPP
mmetsp:Transcript_7575/g.23834  ORF Transcript_7575/g.23834 Transcript_7575/m.23834 type:complete len:131 (-) Transcript_7575:247-639(-)